MATIGDINLQEPSTVTKRLAAVEVTRNSTVQSQEVMVLGSPNSTGVLAFAEVLGAAPASTVQGLAVRIVSGPSSAVDLAVRPAFSSTNTDNPVRAVLSSTNTDNPVRASQGPGISTLGDRWLVTGANSSAADFVPVRLVDSSGTGFLVPGNEYTNGSTYSSHAGPTLTYDNSSNNTYRVVGVAQPLPVQLRTGINTYNSLYSTIVSTASSAFYALISSAAAVRPCVYGYSVTSTAVLACLVEFVSDTVTTVWHTEVGSGSSGVTGGNVALSPPGRLFQSTAVAIPMRVRLGTTGVEVKISVAYFTE